VTEAPDTAVPEDGRVTLVLSSPRVAPGLLSWPTWERLRSAEAVLAVTPEPEWLDAFAEAGVEVEDVGDLPVGERAGRLVERAATGIEVVWWGSPDGDPGLTDALAEHLSRRAIAGRPPEVEVITGSHDVPGARLLDVVDVMDTLRSPGGCPWDAQQTHASLLPHLLEETHEVIEAIESGSSADLQEELGDLLFQIVFHARLAEESQRSPFSIDDVAAGLVAKLVRRHPHVFAGADAPEDLQQTWDELKSAEKPARAGFEGIPATLPALAKAQKMLGRLQKSSADLPSAIAAAAGGDELTSSLISSVLRARNEGVDAESALREALSRLPPPG
jgi:XTP/dITP diphosphohydrolase